MIKEYNHSTFSLHYELVLVSKNKAPIFTDEIAQFGINIFKNISSPYQVTLNDVHYEKDHMHFKFEAYPTTNLYKFINAYKSASSRKIKNNYQQVVDMLNGTAMWEGSYFLMTVGISSKDLVLHYIEEYIKCDEIHHIHQEGCLE
ncbi:IS200/IS605 family transposase [Caviibacter abscessus]|uniref:IS200/IS605 family transposase n=1 Tax=Caviibacter abscessus TaxID=1766719 RepID=UPI00082C55F1|nr:IS200/IS605 family transposase [Caviibacter abscessus]